jgi:hypothetical protein
MRKQAHAPPERATRCAGRDDVQAAYLAVVKPALQHAQRRLDGPLQQKVHNVGALLVAAVPPQEAALRRVRESRQREPLERAVRESR